MFKNLRLQIIGLVFLGILLAFFGGKYLLQIYQIEEPLLAELEQIPGVNQARLEDGEHRTNLYLSLEKEADLYEIYSQSRNISRNYLGEKLDEIRMDNQKAGGLSGIYYELQYDIYQGLATGNFVEMQRNIEGIISKKGMKHRLWLDNYNIYLEVSSGDSSYYRVIPRSKGGERSEGLG